MITYIFRHSDFNNEYESVMQFKKGTDKEFIERLFREWAESITSEFDVDFCVKIGISGIWVRSEELAA